MPREKDCYRLYLERLDQLFPGTELLSVSDVMKLTGRSREWCSCNFKYNFKHGKKKFISKGVLASALS